MFFLLRCAFWLSVVAVALPWVAVGGGLQGDAMRVQAAVRPQAAAQAAPVAAPAAADAAGCSTDLESCVERVAKVDLIALALDQRSVPPEQRSAPNTAGRAVKVAVAVSSRRSAPAKRGADPIAAELRRVARRD